jgi:NAD(P)-dependent dehydrogenase (short-subunit alcohol dehydrogenase family)
MPDTVALVTGGAGNLGRSVSRALLAAGSRVAVPLHKTDQPAALDPLRREYGDRLHTFALDLTTPRGAQQAIEQVVEWAGRLDVVAHLVGGYSGGAKLADTPVEVWDRMLDLNLKSAWLVARYAIPRLVQAGGGSLVFVSSRAALQDRAGQGAYAVSKAALLALVATIAEEYRDQGIRANAVLPGVMDTEANRRATPDADHSLWTAPDEVARVIAFLASAGSGPVNGAAVPVFGRS